ncbi:hypothetical protein Tco_1121653, partial [Tanacetum coccineum]
REGLEARIEYGKAGRELKDVESYDSRRLSRTPPIELVISSLNLEGSLGEEDESLEFFCLQPVSEQLTMPVYYERGVPVSSINPVVVAVVSHEASLVVADYQISSLTIVNDQVLSTETHDDMFDTTMLGKPEDHQSSGPGSS